MGPAGGGPWDAALRREKVWGPAAEGGTEMLVTQAFKATPSPYQLDAKLCSHR